MDSITVEQHCSELHIAVKGGDGFDRLKLNEPNRPCSSSGFKIVKTCTGFHSHMAKSYSLIHRLTNSIFQCCNLCSVGRLNHRNGPMSVQVCGGQWKRNEIKTFYKLNKVNNQGVPWIFCIPRRRHRHHHHHRLDSRVWTLAFLLRISRQIIFLHSVVNPMPTPSNPAQSRLFCQGSLP